MNTRFRPTPYGPPHIGHIYIAGLNYSTAASCGGRFVLQADDVWYDVRAYWRQGWPMEMAVQAHSEALNWMGYEHEVWYSSSNEEMQREACAANGVPWLKEGRPDIRINCPNNPMGNGFVLGPSGVSDPPVAPWYCAVRAADDYACNIDAFARGFDLANEHALYGWMYYKAFRRRPPGQAYFPLICRREGTEKEASSGGATGVLALRDVGYTPYQIHCSLQAVAQKSIHECWNAYWIPAKFLTAREVRPMPFVVMDYVTLLLGIECDNMADYWAAEKSPWESATERLRMASRDMTDDDLEAAHGAEMAEAFIREDVAKQGFDPDQIIKALRDGHDLYDWAVQYDVRPETRPEEAA